MMTTDEGGSRPSKRICLDYVLQHPDTSEDPGDREIGHDASVGESSDFVCFGMVRRTEYP